MADERWWEGERGRGEKGGGGRVGQDNNNDVTGRRGERRERERERERERKRDRQTERQRDREIEKKKQTKFDADG